MNLEKTKTKIESELAEFYQAITSLDEQIQELESHLSIAFQPQGKPEEILKQNQQERERRQGLSQNLNDFLSDKRSLQLAREKKEEELAKVAEQIRKKEKLSLFSQLVNASTEINNLSSQLVEKLSGFEQTVNENRKLCGQEQICNSTGADFELSVSRLPMFFTVEERQQIRLLSRNEFVQKEKEKENAIQ